MASAQILHLGRKYGGLIGFNVGDKGAMADNYIGLNAWPALHGARL